MGVLELDSAEDERLAPYRDLRGRGLRKNKTFIVEGEHLVERLVSSSLEVASVLVSSRKAERFGSMLAG